MTRCRPVWADYTARRLIPISACGGGMSPKRNILHTPEAGTKFTLKDLCNPVCQNTAQTTDIPVCCMTHKQRRSCGEPVGIRKALSCRLKCQIRILTVISAGEYFHILLNQTQKASRFRPAARFSEDLPRRPEAMVSPVLKIYLQSYFPRQLSFLYRVLTFSGSAIPFRVVFPLSENGMVLSRA